MINKSDVIKKIKVLKNDEILKRLIKTMVVGYLDYRRLKLKVEDVYDEISIAQINIDSLLCSQGFTEEEIGLIRDSELFNSWLDGALEIEKSEAKKREVGTTVKNS